MDQVTLHDGAKPILIYDAECRFCVISKEAIEVGDTGTGARFIPYQAEEAARCLGSEYQPGRPDVAYLVEPDGTIRRGLDAFIPLLPKIRGGRFFLFILRLPFGRPIGKVLYQLIARYRYRWFGKQRTPNLSHPKHYRH